MAQIRIRVGANLDRSVDVVFGQIEKRSQRAAKTVERNLQAVSGKGGPYRQMLRETDVAMTATERAVQRSTQRQRRTVDLATRDMARAYAQIGKVAEREMMRGTRADMRARERFAQRTSHRATRMFWPNAPIMGGARRIGSDLLRGAGVNFDVGAAVQRNVGLERSAIALSNQGFQRGQVDRFGRPTANAARVAPEALMGEARQLGGQFGRDPNEVIDALTRFTNVTGDLNSGRQTLTQLASLAAATGTDLGDMAEAAANVSTQLEDTPDKAQRLASVMATIAGQGKLGAVEIKDMATQMSRIAAQAPSFEGDVAGNIEKLGALAQLSRKLGGAPSAAEAARSVGGFATTLQKGKRIAAFREAGVNVFADKGQTKFKDPFQLIRESLTATGGNLEKLNKLFMDVVGARAVKGLAGAFNEAGGGAAGIEAVNRLISELTKGASLQQDEIAESNRRVQESTAAKAQRFQNELDSVVQTMQAELLPELQKLAPAALSVTKAFTGILTWAAGNPMQAVTAALAASVARAGLESVLRQAIERAVLGNAAGSLTGAAGGAAGMGGGAAAAGLAPVAAAVAAIVGLGLAADQASKLMQQLNPEVKGAADRVKRFKENPEAAKRDFQREFAADINREELRKAGIINDSGRVELSPSALASGVGSKLTPETIRQIEASVDPKGVEQIGNAVRAELSKILRVQITNVDEIRASSGKGVELPSFGRESDAATRGPLRTY